MVERRTRRAMADGAFPSQRHGPQALRDNSPEPGEGGADGLASAPAYATTRTP